MQHANQGKSASPRLSREPHWARNTFVAQQALCDALCERQIEIAGRGEGVVEDARADEASYSSAQCTPIDERHHVHLPLGPPRPQRPALRRLGARHHEQLPRQVRGLSFMVGVPSITQLVWE